MVLVGIVEPIVEPIVGISEELGTFVGLSVTGLRDDGNLKGLALGLFVGSTGFVAGEFVGLVTGLKV